MSDRQQRKERYYEELKEPKQLGRINTRLQEVRDDGE